jgi:hypothetical protein
MESASIPTCNFRIRKVFLAQVSNPKISNAIPLGRLIATGRLTTYMSNVFSCHYRIKSTAVRFDLFRTNLDGEGMPPAPSPSRRHYRAFMSFTPEAGNPLKLRAD